MATRMLKFTALEKDAPPKRAADERREDFHEIYADFIAEKAAEQSSRCSQCGVPFCQQHCPLGNNIPDWLMLTAEGRLEEAYRVSSATNNMPEICGRICPQDRLCEGNCVIEQSGHGTVTIGAVEEYITDTAWEEGWVAPIRPPRERDQSVGVVGAGPAGLAAAEQLRLKGYKVTVYDRHDRAGGLLIYGIPGFKLEKDIVERRTERLIEGGVEFVLNCNVGTNVTLTELRARHDAVLLGNGVYKARGTECTGQRIERCHLPALEYLTASNRADFHEGLDEAGHPAHYAAGKRVVVIGGGDTAMDCVRTAIRQDAASVTCLYRRNRENMPGSRQEVANAEEEGVHFEWLAAPKAVLERDGQVTKVRAARMRLGLPDATGRHRS